MVSSAAGDSEEDAASGALGSLAATTGQELPIHIKITIYSSVFIVSGANLYS